MCLQGADHSVWIRPEATLVLPATPFPQPTAWDVARMVVAVPFYGAALGLLSLGLVAFILGNVVTGRRGR